MQFPVRFRSTQRNGTEFAVRTEDGWSVRQTAKAKADSVLGQPLRLRVAVQGSNVLAYLDGELVIETAFALDRQRGCVGLGLSGGKVRFDDFSVRRLPDTPPLSETKISRCEIVGHRGWAAVYPENTLVSAKMAVQAGADGTEFDVQATRDGVVVLLHDKTLDRTTDGTGELAAKTLAELRSLDAGSWKDPQFAGEPLPTLEQQLRALKGTGCQPVIEIKMTGISDKVIQAVRDLDMVDQVAVIAFSGEVVTAPEVQVRTTGTVAPLFGLQSLLIALSIMAHRGEIADHVQTVAELSTLPKHLLAAKQAFAADIAYTFPNLANWSAGVRNIGFL